MFCAKLATLFFICLWSFKYQSNLFISSYNRYNYSDKPHIRKHRMKLKNAGKVDVDACGRSESFC